MAKIGLVRGLATLQTRVATVEHDGVGSDGAQMRGRVIDSINSSNRILRLHAELNLGEIKSIVNCAE